MYNADRPSWAILINDIYKKQVQISQVTESLTTWPHLVTQKIFSNLRPGVFQTGISLPNVSFLIIIYVAGCPQDRQQKAWCFLTLLVSYEVMYINLKLIWLHYNVLESRNAHHNEFLILYTIHACKRRFCAPVWYSM